MPNEERNYYVICDDHCLFPSMTYEQIIEAIAEATGNTPQHVEDAFITKIKESNHNANLTFWKGTEAEFNALQVTAAAYKVAIDTNGKLYFTPYEETPVTPESIGAATAESFTANIGTTWTGSAAPYSQVINISGIKDSDTPIIDVVLSSTYATAEAQLEAWANIFRIVTGANRITVYANDKTETVIPIKLLCVRS